MKKIEWISIFFFFVDYWTMILGSFGSEENGEGEDSDKKDWQSDKQASDLLKEEEWTDEESERAGDTLRRRSWSHDLLQHRQALWFLQHQVRF